MTEFYVYELRNGVWYKIGKMFADGPHPNKKIALSIEDHGEEYALR